MDDVIDLRDAVARPWTGRYLRLLAGVLLLGAAVHVGNLLGLGGTPWGETPVLWRVMDVVLLGFNLIVAPALWARKPWSILAYVGGIILLQVVPYALFREVFVQTDEDVGALLGLLGIHVLLLFVLFVLVIGRK